MRAKKPECVVFGQTVRALRKKQGYSQEEFADEARIDRSYMGRIERGEQTASLSMIHHIARALKLPPDRLLRS